VEPVYWACVRSTLYKVGLTMFHSDKFFRVRHELTVMRNRA
jgi:hypothetical protein